MDFSLDEGAAAASSVAAGLLRGQTGSAELVWKAMAEAGLLGLAVPESLGGEGLGVLETSAVLTEVGRAAADVPALATLALGVLPITALGTPDQQEYLLAGVADGERLFTAALREPSAPLPAQPATTAVREGQDLLLTGRKVGVPHAATAHRILVPVSLPFTTAVIALDPAAEGVTLTRTPTSSATPEHTVTLDRARVPASAVLGGDTAVTRLNEFALAGAAALADGAVAGALDLTSAHLGSREQFGRPLATFQAVAQQVAEVSVVSRTLSLAATSANWRLATGRDATGDLAVAAYWLASEAPAALQTCQHLHGGIGLDVTYPLHRYFSLVTDLARFVGGAEPWTGELGDLVVAGMG